MKKQVLSGLLVLCLIFSLLPMNAFAENSNATTEPTMDVGGTTSVGKMISNEISAQKAETAQDESNISDLVVEGDIATVTFMTNAAECDIVVGIYDENDETRMLASGTASAFSGVNKVSVDLSGEIPTNFVATAYMLESTSHSPLCKAYTTQLYTTEMQAFLATTVNDYDKELVLSLDENEETNFAVFNSETLRISESDGMTVEDKGDGTYIVSNAADSVKSLSKGDEFAFTYDDGTVLLVSVASVNVNGTTVTITEATDADLQDFFDYVKIEGANDSSSEASIDTSCMDDSVTLVNESPAGRSSTYARDTNKEGSYGSSFSVNLNDDRIKGSLTFSYELSLKVYVNSSYKYVSLTADLTKSLSVTLTAFKDEISFNLPSVDVYVMPGVYARLKPTLVAEASVSLKWTGNIKSTIGFAYDSDSGFVNKCSSPSCDSKLELSGKVFLGLKISLDAVIISDKLASAGIESKAGAELSAKVRLDEESSGSKIHDCDKCLQGSISFVISLTAKANFIIFEVENTFAEYKFKISDFYRSTTFGDYGWGTCPHISYKVSLTVLDKDGNPATDAIIECDGLDYCPNVDSKGVASFYLPNGEYSIHVEANGQTADKNITVHDTGKELSIRLAAGAQSAESGKCGDNLTWTLDSEGTLTVSGTGEMYNYDFNNDTYTPWYDQGLTVKKAVIKSGVTSIGDYAFYWCDSLTSISIPNSVTNIGDYAFYECHSLTSISIPDSVTSIGDYAFNECDSLTSISIPDSVTSIGNGAFEYCHSLTSISIPNSVTSIGDAAFSGCKSLTSINVAIGNPDFSSYNGELFNKKKTVLICCPGGKTEYSLPDSVTSIGNSAFEYCHSLTSISIPDSVTSIGNSAFYECHSLTSISIPNSVTSIGKWAFSWCDSLTSISIPNSVTSIGEYAFYWCDSLTSISIPNSVTSIGEYAFFKCDSLTSISIPNSVTSIGKRAFSRCDSLTSINVAIGNPDYSSYNGALFNKEKTVLICCPGGKTEYSIPDGVTSIGDYAFYECDSLTSISIPNSVTSIGDSAFSWCNSLTSISIPDSVTSIGTWAFYWCNSLTDVYYSGTKDQWNKISVGSFNSELTNANIHFNSTAPASMAAETFSLTKNPASVFSAESINTEETGVKTSHFSDLQSGVQYVFIVVLDPEAEAYLGSDNLCYIAQKQSDASGSVSFAYYSAAESVSECIYVLHDHSYADGVCTICGIVDPNYEPPHTHSYSATVTVPTCTEQGFTTYTCACGDSYVDSYTDALGHSYGAWKQTEAPTCTAKGTETRTCTRCNAFEIRDVAPTGHHYTAAVTAPTCTAQGYTTHTCTCGDSYVDSYTNALGHSYKNGTCTRCGAKNPNYVAAPVLKITTSAGKPQISWNAVDGATKYWIYRSTDGKTFKYYDSTTKTSYTNKSTSIGTTYYYKVKAVKTVDGTNYTSDLSGAKSILCKPAAPTVSIYRTNGKPQLKWSAVTGATKYWIYRSTDGKTFKYYDSTTKTSYTNKSTSIGTTYYYKVKAVKTVDGTNYTSDLSGAKSILCKPAAPTVSIYRTNGKPQLKWSAVDGATKYWIYRSTDGVNFSYYDSTTKTSYTNSGAASGKKYYYRVKAVAVVNGTNVASANSNTKSLMTTLAKPTVSITTSNGKPKITWKAVTGADKYYVYRSTDGKNFSYYDSTTKLSYTNTGAKKNTKYYYKIKAVCASNSYANSAYSAVVSIKATK